MFDFKKKYYGGVGKIRRKFTVIRIKNYNKSKKYV